MIENCPMLNKSKKRLIFLCVFFHISCLGLAESLQKLLDRYKQSSARVSVLVIDAKTGQTLYSHYPNMAMIPASNMKIITSAAALHYMGGQYTFKTSVGILGNDLIVVGGGDPLLGDPKHDTYPSEAANAMIDAIIQQITAAGFTQFENLIIDTSFFDNQAVHPSWPLEQLNKWYACEVSGLNFYTNCIHLNVTRQGSRAVLKMTPQNTYIQLVNQLKLITSGSSAVGTYRNSVPNKLIVRGRLNQKAGFDVAIENPAGLFASVLKDKLISSGIAVQGQLLEQYIKNNDKIRYLVVIETPIDKVLKRCNTNSLGLAAESLVKTISAENTMDKVNGQWSHGLELTSAYLRSLKIPSEQFVLDDGSGLSRKNRLSTKCLIAVLADMYKNRDSDIFFSSLAIGGVDGTIGKYFKESPYKGNILGKTGYISGVRSFSGICKTIRGDILFSILTENGNGSTRQCINEITKAIYDGTL